MSADRAILHSDMNSFYASVEMMLDPKLRGKAVAVCGSTENRHGIVLAKSELAKRAGVKTGMVNWEAKQRCKDLILVPPQYDQYLKYSKLAHEIYYRYTDLVEPFGMDECWLDVTGCEIYGKPLEIAEEIRQSVKEELGLTVSIGVSFNKIFAKLGSDLKKPDAITVITKQNFKENIWPLAASELLYVGSATTKKLASYGIKTIGDLAATEPSTLKYMFGINGLKLWRYANEEEVLHVLLELSQDVGHRLRVHGLAATGVQIFVRNKSLYSTQYQYKLPFKTQLPSEIAAAGFQLFKEHYIWTEKVRAITIRAIDLIPQTTEEQLSLMVDYERRDRRVRLEDAIEDLRRRFGKKSLTYAGLLGNLKMPDDGRDSVKMPGLMYQ